MPERPIEPMRSHFLSPCSLLLALCAIACAAPSNKPIILDEQSVKNLGIETVEATASDFEDTVFALGSIGEVPQRHAVLSSRINGRILEIKAFAGDSVQQGDVLVRVESRQPGDPPPVIELKSPISGLVLESHVRLGEPVEPDKELLDISDLREVYAIARVPEHHAAKLQPGARAHIRVAALGDKAIDGELLRFGTSADRESGTVDAIFRVPNEELKMRPGMRAEFSIVMAKRENVMSVPRAALQGDPANRVVYVKDFDLKNAFLRTPVQVGAMNDRYVEIISGLMPGDEVVAKGAYPLGFASGSGPSLKEALDAAHGHEHNEDGSEMTSQQRSAKAKGDHEHAEESGSPRMQPLTWFFAGLSFILLVLLGISMKRRTENPDEKIQDRA